MGMSNSNKEERKSTFMLKDLGGWVGGGEGGALLRNIDKDEGSG